MRYGIYLVNSDSLLNIKHVYNNTLYRKIGTFDKRLTFLSLYQGRKAVLKSYITELSKEFSVLSQFTSFVAIEERVKIFLASR